MLRGCMEMKLGQLICVPVNRYRSRAPGTRLALAAVLVSPGEPLLMTFSVRIRTQVKLQWRKISGILYPGGLMSMGLCCSIVARFSAMRCAGQQAARQEKRAETSDANGNNRDNDVFIGGTPYKDDF